IVGRPFPQSKPTVDVETSPPEIESGKSKGKTLNSNTANILEQAKKKYESGDLDGAIEQVKSIPVSASSFQEIAEMITQWQQDWAKSEALFNDINQALDRGQWDKVLAYKDHPEKLPNLEYWRKKIEPLFQQAAENLAKQKQPQEGKHDFDSQAKP
ncbi:MAG: serine/threonine protein kinase, partial [Fischerella sp.]|nr:serine/threonine protein kinase [Fischerella sp.]